MQESARPARNAFRACLPRSFVIVVADRRDLPFRAVARACEGPRRARASTASALICCTTPPSGASPLPRALQIHSPSCPSASPTTSGSGVAGPHRACESLPPRSPSLAHTRTCPLLGSRLNICSSRHGAPDGETKPSSSRLLLHHRISHILRPVTGAAGLTRA